jgi:GNAT superfamily N-acetyltransferase
MTKSSTDIDVIRASQVHIDLLAPLFDGYRQFYRQPSDLVGARKFLSERLTNDESVIFLALMDDSALGFTQLYPLFSSVSMRSLWLLNDLYVAPEGRRLGVGTALMERARRFSIETGAKGLNLATEITNVSAQALYEGQGWIRDEQFYHYALNT